MYDRVKYPQTSCACGEHNCASCVSNTDGNPMNCLEWECYAGAQCKYKKRLQHPDWTVCQSRGCEYYHNGFAGMECLAGFDSDKIMTCQESKTRLEIKKSG